MPTATTKHVQQEIEEVRDEIEALQPDISYHEVTIAFGDLGAGASDSITIEDFPTNVVYQGIAAQADPQFTGEADLTFAVGYEGGDTDAFIEATDLHETGTTPIAIVQGVVTGGTFLADASTAGLAVLFAATELNDVSAGTLKIRFLYSRPFPVEE